FACVALSFHLRLYSFPTRRSSDLFDKTLFKDSGVSDTLVGRIASCASWAPSFCLSFLVAPRYDLPYSVSIWLLASVIAVSDMRVESVGMYVIKPVIPPAALPRSIPSYNCWAIIIVFFALKLIDLAASCCNDDVINGFAGFLFLSLRFTLSILNSLFFIFSKILSTSS